MRPRFSLRTVVLLMGIAALLLVVWRQYVELGPLREENRRLRAELGALDVQDKSRLHAVQAPQPDEHTWKWRVWIPPGKHYRVAIAGAEISEEGFPKNSGRIELVGEGEEFLTYRIVRDPRTNSWQGTLTFADASIGAYPSHWVEWSNISKSTKSVGNVTAIAEPGEPLMLIRCRVAEAITGNSFPSEPTDGFMIWIEPIP
jgi:hypothetical protein